MKTAAQMYAEVDSEKRNQQLLKDAARNESVIRARMEEGYPGWFALYSGGSPAGMVMHLQVHGYQARVDGSTVWCRV